MNNEPDEVEEVLSLIRAGSMKVNEENAERVKNAWRNSLLWRGVFEKAGLGSLPDPEGAYTDGPEALEEWLFQAYKGNFKEEYHCRMAFNRVKAAILEEAT